MKSASRFSLCQILLLVLALGSTTVSAQPNLNFERDRAKTMLRVIKDDIKKHYYDPTFHGIDLDARFKQAEDKMLQAQDLGQLFGIIGQVLVEFDDSHLFFSPPNRASKTEYGFQMQAVGDRCFIAAVKPGSDAEAKGVKVGDEILAVNGFNTAREIMWKITYMFYSLRPQPGLALNLKTPDGQMKQVVVAAKIRRDAIVKDMTNTIIINDYLRELEDEDRLSRSRYYEVGEQTLIWKLPEFAVSPDHIDSMLGKARKRENLILDLRGNPGGYVETLKWMAGYFFRKDLKIADLKGRKEMKPILSKWHGENDQFKGKVVVLIDSRSASAAEIFARLVQLEKRGTVIGDRSAGAVMQSLFHSHEMGNDTVIFYGASVTNADVVMTDGKSLEHTGVQPDELLLPSAKDQAAGHDVVLARAAALVGLKLSPEEAGKIFPLEWRKR